MKRIVVGLLVGITCLLGTSMVMAEDPQDVGGPYLFHSEGDIPVVQVNYTGTDTWGVGLWAETKSSVDRSTGVVGWASAETGDVYGVNGISDSDKGIGVFGKASAEEGVTYGVYGLSKSSEGIGVYGKASAGYGVWGSSDAEGKAGVIGWNWNPKGYAMFSFGNMHVVGNLTVDGSIESTNLALNTANNPVTVWASSEHGQDEGCTTYSASCINDGKAGYWDKYEWATDGEKSGNFKYYDSSTGLQGAKIELKWKEPLWKMTRVVIYPRPNKYDKVEDCWLQVMQVEEDGTTVKAVNNIHLGQLHTPREIKLEDAEGANVKAVGVLITETTSDTYNIGLAEIECYRE